MSDSVANVEIEDVLSSIRRLFSEDKRPVDVAKEEQQGTFTSSLAKSKEALVLTPAFRVKDESPVSEKNNVAQVFTHSSVATENEPESHDAFALDEKPVEFSHSSEPLVLHKPLNQENLTSNDSVSAENEEIRADISKAQSRLEATIAELEAVISGQPNDWEPDGSEIAGSSPETQPLKWAASEDAEKLTRAMVPDEQPIDIAFMRPVPQPEVQSTSPTGDVAVNDDQFEETPVSETIVEIEQIRAVEPSQEIAENAPSENVPEEFEGFDEEALREVVSEIVRQELQGALGERITRNVRKLVRREIHRIVSSPDFD